MQKSVKPSTRVQQSRRQSTPATKTAQAQTGPRPLDEQQLRQVAGGLPHPHW